MCYYKIIIMLVVLCAFSCAGGENNGTIRLMTYNIHHGEGSDGIYDLARIGAFIKNQNIDIAGLQEVDSFYSERSRNENQPEFFGKYTGFHAYFGPNIRKNYGNLVLSRFAIKQAYNVPLPNPDNKESRGLIVTELNIHGKHIMFVNTHLCAFSQVDRIAQVHKIIDVISKFDKPCIVAGDFNSRPFGELKPLIDSGLIYSSRELMGFAEAIDDIYVSKELKTAVIKANVIEKPYSDHPAYEIELDFSKIPM